MTALPASDLIALTAPADMERQHPDCCNGGVATAGRVVFTVPAEGHRHTALFTRQTRMLHQDGPQGHGTTDFPATFDGRLALANDAAAAPEQRLAAAELIAGEGLFREMAAVAAAVEPLPAFAARARRLAMVCRQYERWGLHKRLEPVSRPGIETAALAVLTRNALLRRADGARSCVVVFMGTASQFWVSVYMLERLLPADCHILFLKDPGGASYALGTPAFGRRFTDLTSGLHSVLSDLGVSRAQVIGTSSGGFAALHFALTTGAAAVLALSPETTLLPVVSNLRVAGAAEVVPDLETRLPAPLDLVALYATHPAPPPAVLVHAAGHAADAAMCRRLAGLPGVELCPVPDCDQHDTLAPLIRSGAMRGLLDRLFAAR